MWFGDTVVKGTMSVLLCSILTRYIDGTYLYFKKNEVQQTCTSCILYRIE